MTYSKTFLVLGTAAALTAGALTPSFAAPVLGSTATIGEAATPTVTNVRWRGGGGAVAGIATGLIVGGAIAAASQPRYYNPGYGYYDNSYAYEPGYAYQPAPVYSYEPAPVYETAPAYSYGGCGYRASHYSYEKGQMEGGGYRC